MSASINSISTYISLPSLAERISNVERDRQNCLTQIQIRENKITAIDKEINAREEYVALLKERQVTIKESIEINLQIIANNKAIITHYENLNKRLTALNEETNKRLTALNEETNKRLLALFDNKSKSSVVTGKTDAEVSNLDLIEKDSLVSNSKKLEINTVEKVVERLQVVKPHDYSVILYQPNSFQIKLLAAQNKISSTKEDITHSQESLKFDKVMQQLIYYSQKNILENIKEKSFTITL